MLFQPGTPSKWFDQAVESAIPQPCFLHILHHTDSIGSGRAKGFALGTSPFVGCLDPDDYLLPGAVQACVAALEADPKAVGAFTDEIWIDDADGALIGHGHSTGTGAWDKARQMTQVSYGRHLAIMRREHVTRYLHDIADIDRLSEWVLRGLITQHGHWVHVEMDGYAHRIHDGNTGKTTTAAQIKAAYAKVLPVLQPKKAVERSRYSSAAKQAYFRKVYGCCG